MLLYQRYTILKLLLGDIIGVAQNNASCISDLIIEKLAEILHVHLALVSVNNSSKSVEHRALCVSVFDGFLNVGKLADTRGLYKDPIRLILIDHLVKRLSKISNQGTTDTA